MVRDKILLDDACYPDRLKQMPDNQAYWTQRWADQMNYRYWKERLAQPWNRATNGVARRTALLRSNAGLQDG